MMTPSDQARLDAKIDKTPGLGIGDCWEWTAYCNPVGYGSFSLNAKPVLAHRVTAWLAGLIPSLDSTLEIDHKECQNKKCCNPAHLQAMTKSEHHKKTNACGEVDNRGHTRTRGENNGQSKLTEAQVWDIHEKYATGNFTQINLAETYGVSRGTIVRILNGKSWHHIFEQFN